MRFIVFALIFLLAGCSQPRLDTSSEKAFKESISEVRESLPSEQRAAFEAAVAQAGLGAMMASMFTKAPVAATQGFEQFNGMTGPEIIAFAKAQQEKSAASAAAALAKMKADDDAEIAKLEATQQAREAAIAKLSAIQISDPAVRERSSGFMKSTELTATIKNNLDVALARVDFEYAATSPGRSVPWDSGDGAFFIDGGLEPGESRALSTTVAGIGSMFGFITLGKAMQEHPDSVLLVKVTDAAGADKQRMVPPKLNPWDASRLDEHRKSNAAPAAQ